MEAETAYFLIFILGTEYLQVVVRIPRGDRGGKDSVLKVLLSVSASLLWRRRRCKGIYTVKNQTTFGNEDMEA